MIQVMYLICLSVNNYYFFYFLALVVDCNGTVLGSDSKKVTVKGEDGDDEYDIKGDGRNNETLEVDNYSLKEDDPDYGELSVDLLACFSIDSHGYVNANLTVNANPNSSLLIICICS